MKENKEDVKWDKSRENYLMQNERGRERKENERRKKRKGERDKETDRDAEGGVRISDGQIKSIR